MARQTESYMGGFSGKLGPAIGYRWNGVWCVRSCPTKVSNPRTAKQMAHRQMFKAEVQLAARMRWAVNNGLREASREANMTPYNLFVSMNQACFSLEEGDFKVDYPSLALSCGTAAPVGPGTATVDAGNVLEVSFEKNPLHLQAGLYDSVYLYIYAPAAGQGYLAAPVYRRSKKLSVSLPDQFNGEQVHLYLMVRNEAEEWSETTYAGCVVIAPSSTIPESPSAGSAPQAIGSTYDADTEHTGNKAFVANQPLDNPDIGHR